MDKYTFFWKTMELCDWEHEGDDELVLEPVIKYLSTKDDMGIFEFENLMSELLYALDTRKLAKQCKKSQGCFSDDSFLYSRCVALINGEAYYRIALRGKFPRMWGMEFESLLYVAPRAWARKHQKNESEYPNIPPVSYETGSNKDGWKKRKFLFLG
jgi:hypothetical protein